MSIVINTNPTGLPSVHDNMWHVVSSDNSGQVDFKYVFDVYRNGVQLIRVKQTPEPGNGRGYFDAGPTVRNEMTYNWFEPIADEIQIHEPNMQGEIGIVYALRVGEDVSGVTTLNMASGEVSGYNWAPPLFQRGVATVASKIENWVTNRPNIANAAVGESLYIGFATQPGTSMIFKAETFDHNNNLIASTSEPPVIFTSGFYQYNIGPLAMQTQVMPVTGVKYYEVWFHNGLTDLARFRVYITCNPKYNCIPIHFLNRFGMWDTQRFDLVSKLMMKVERKDFSKRDYEFNGNSVDYASSSGRYYEGRVSYSNIADWTYKLTADGMTDDEWVWMADLIQSPQILMEIDGYHYPVTIKENNYEYKKFVNDRLKPLEIEFEMNTPRSTQLR